MLDKGPKSSIIAALLLAVSLVTASWGRATERAVEFNIPPQALGSALLIFAKQADVQVSVSTTAIAGMRTAGVVGKFTPSVALTRLLVETDLRFNTVGERTYAVAEEKASDNAQPSEAPSPPTEASTPPATPAAASAGAVESTKKKNQGSDAENELGTADLGDILVTGTFIRGAPPASAVITLDRGAIDRSGLTAVGDVVRSLPQNFSGGNSPQVVVGSAPGINDPISGGTAPNLRGLGSGSTLTLVNGRRLAQDTFSGGVDVSLIPLDAVERIEIVTDSASATYGSDAVAGVVNFILTKNFDGAKTGASLGTATEGGGDEWRISQLLGRTWDKGGALISYEHASQDAVFSSDRDFTSSAAAPSALLPSGSRDSVLVSGSQDLSASVSVFVDALYASRDSGNVSTFPGDPPLGFGSDTEVEQYTASAGVNVLLPARWNARAFVTTASQESKVDSYLFTPPSSDRTPIDRAVFSGTTESIELVADGPISAILSNELRAAIGGGHRRDTYEVGVPAFDFTFSDGLREVDYVFGEIAVPLVPATARKGFVRLDINLSGRFEDYSDVGRKTVPKVGLAYAPSRSIEVQASWGKSFRAPSLNDLFALRSVSLYEIDDPISPTGTSIVLAPEGANAELQPETATSWTAGLEVGPERIPGLQIRATYFDIDYQDRIGEMANVFTALSDPANAELVVRNPSAELQQRYIDNANGGFVNTTGSPYDPSTVAAIADARQVNIARQDVSGVDALVDYRLAVVSGEVALFLNSTYFELRQQLTSLSVEQALAGKTFNPPRFRGRGGATWTARGWSITGIINHLGDSVNTFQPERSRVSSWTTLDAQLSYHSDKSGPLGGLRASISVQNLLGKDPPFIQFDTFREGFDYDPVNATPLGRFVSLELTKSW